MFGFKDDRLNNVAYFENDIMTVSQLYDVLGKLIEYGKGDYKVTTEAYTCSARGVDLLDDWKEIDIS